MKATLQNTNTSFRLFCVSFCLLLIGVTNVFAQANPRFSGVDPANDQVTITNYGDAAIDISSYWLCLGGGTYRMIGDLTPPGTSTNLMPNGALDVLYSFLNPTSGGLGLYSTNAGNFVDENVLDDYVQWGAGGAQREPIAVAAGLWTANDFIAGDGPYMYFGDGSQNGLTAWSEPIDGGTLTGGPFEFCAGDDVADMIAANEITLTGNTGAESQWVITDDQGVILGLPGSFTEVNFDGAGAGTCLVWHLSHDGSLMGAAMGATAPTDLTGNFDLSNPISVVRNQPEGGTLTGGLFEFLAGDGNADNIPVGGITLSGNSGGNSQWVVTDDQGVILGLPPSPDVVNFDGAGVGVCLVWHLSFEDGLTGAAEGNNAMTDLVGCYSLSNPISVSRTSNAMVDGGTLSGGPFSFCAGDGVADMIDAGDITLAGNVGSESQWVVTDIEGQILGLPPTFSEVNFDNAGTGECLIWYVSHDGSLAGAVIGANALADLVGNFDLSNSVSVVRDGVNAGMIQIAGTTETTATICADDGVGDPIEVEFVDVGALEGNFQTWVVTNSAGDILMTPSSGPFNFEGAGPGVCNIWYLSYNDANFLDGVTNASQLNGCFDLAGPIAVTRLEGTDCDTLSTTDFDTNLPVTIYPVPARTELQVSLTEVSANVTLEVFDLLGKKVLQKTNVSSSNAAINVSELATGSYVLAVDNGLGGRATKMFTVTKY